MVSIYYANKINWKRTQLEPATTNTLKSKPQQQRDAMMSERSQSKHSSPYAAQRLNNKAAVLIETGKYDSAIRNLLKAIIMTGNQEKINRPLCSCGSCSLKATISFSQHSAQRDQKNDGQEDSGETGGFIYKQPLRVSPHSMGHSMGGCVFSLMVTFNLGLAHHLSAIEKEEGKENRRRQKFQKSLSLYELVYRWQMEEEVGSLGFSMIIVNNLGEIHREEKDFQKLEICLQNLLSTMMYVIVVDYDNDDDRELVNLDGFVQNTSSLILQGQCTGAA
jgi:tetratricopeptide (TPR) repeat protein